MKINKSSDHTSLNKNKMNYNVNEKGYYGAFGGAYIPEMLYPNVEELLLALRARI